MDSVFDFLKSFPILTKIGRLERVCFYFRRTYAMVSYVRDHCMCKELPVISVNRAVDKKRISRKNGGLRRRRGTRGRC
jgi:hypothetical protein